MRQSIEIEQTKATADDELPVIARFEVRRRSYLAPDGTVQGLLPGFAGSPFSTARAVLHASTRRLAIMMLRLRPLNSARRSEPVDLWTGEEPAHKLPRRSSSNSRRGHLMCYKPRTSSRATDTQFVYGSILARYRQPRT
jgi:hypothetical protein